MIQLVLIFMCCFSSTFAESGEVLGSRVITNSSGKVGPMYFNSADDFDVYLHKRGSSQPEQLTIEEGNCALGGSIIGSPCVVQPGRSVITFDEVPDYDLLVLVNLKQIYTVYFAKDCKFPNPKDGHIIVEKSIPLYRFLSGKTEENVVFAMKGTNYTGIKFQREDSVVCEWKDSIPVTGECANLIVDEASSLIIFNATFTKTDGNDYQSFTWGRKYDVISVNLDWTNTGEAPEVKACNIQGEQTTTSNAYRNMESYLV
ncbi:unnamed protein product [Hymenolepis diminuta]|uniref:DUF5727 domain-containing protein n=1 Tax=Hymenolepis diminuta TaxID=6216 RepID=A0A564XZZ7_HYMDI|nr:unnamed protein product [Hymenolepis diminuta]